MAAERVAPLGRVLEGDERIVHMVSHGALLFLATDRRVFRLADHRGPPPAFIEIPAQVSALPDDPAIAELRARLDRVKADPDSTLGIAAPLVAEVVAIAEALLSRMRGTGGG